jgi:hypothetical protein
MQESAKPSLKTRLTLLLEEYGKIAIAIYFVIFALVLSGFVLAIQLGLEVQSAHATAGTLGAAWVATKLTQPLRIVATLVLTPIIGRFVKRPKPV